MGHLVSITEPKAKIGDIIEFIDKSSEYFREHAKVTRFDEEGKIYVEVIDGHNKGVKGGIASMKYKIYCSEWDI